MKKKIALVLSLILTVVIAGMIACNSSKRPSKNNEGITELTGPADQDHFPAGGKATVTTMGWDDPGNR